jgi:hypothetical protein
MATSSSPGCGPGRCVCTCLCVVVLVLGEGWAGGGEGRTSLSLSPGILPPAELSKQAIQTRPGPDGRGAGGAEGVSS